MKKLLFTSLLSLGLLLPASISASTNNTTSKTEFSTKKPRKSSKGRKSSRVKKAKSYSSSSRTSSRSYSKSNDGCTYNGHQLYVGPRGGCYYYSGSSKQYVDRSYCSSCN